MRIKSIYKREKWYNSNLFIIIKYVEASLFILIGVLLFFCGLGNEKLGENLIVLFVFIGIIKALFFPFFSGAIINIEQHKIIITSFFYKKIINFNEVKIVYFVSEESIKWGKGIGIEVLDIYGESNMIYFETTFLSSKNKKIKQIEKIVKDYKLNLLLNDR